MNNPLRDDGNGNYLVGKKNVYLSLAIVVLIVGASGYTVKRATNFEHTLDWNTRQIAQIIAKQDRHTERLAAIELKANRLEWRLDRLDSRVRGDSHISPINPVPTYIGPLNGGSPHDAE